MARMLQKFLLDSHLKTIQAQQFLPPTLGLQICQETRFRAFQKTARALLLLFLENKFFVSCIKHLSDPTMPM